MKKTSDYAVAVIGLGSMGFGAAASCINAGLTTYGVDINPQALERLRQAGAAQADTRIDAFADKLDAVVLLVVNAAQVNGILFGEPQVAAKLKPAPWSWCLPQSPRRMPKTLNSVWLSIS